MKVHEAEEIREPAGEYDKRRVRSVIARLKTAGRIRPAKADLRDLGFPADEPHELSISEARHQQRTH